MRGSGVTARVTEPRRSIVALGGEYGAMDLNRLSPTGSNCGSPAGYVPPSRTHEYKKLMKPLMERKRRARMNMCIEEIRDLISGQLAAPGQRASRDDDLVSRMDKAEVLELAVKHIHKQLMSSRRPDPYTEVKMFHQGYLSARAIINDYLNSQQEGDPTVLHRLNSHLDRLVTVPPAAAPLAAPLRVLPAAAAPLPTPTATLAPSILPRPQARPPPAVEAKLEKTDVPPPPASTEGPINLSKSAFRPVGSKSSTSASISSSSIDPNSWRPW